MKAIQTVAAALAAAVAALAGGGCATSNSPYRPPDEPRHGRTVYFNSYDLQQCAVAMIDSMLADRALDKKLQRQFPDRVPVVDVKEIRNETYQLGLQLDSIADTMRTRLTGSGKFDFVDREMERVIAGEIADDMDSALVDADYLLNGCLKEIRDGDDRVSDSYYKLTMNLWNKRTGKIDWSGEKELRKVSERPAVGW